MFKVIKYSLVVLIFFIFLFPLARSFLVLDEKPKKVDVIIVLSGATERLEKAVELYHEGYADKIMLSVSTEKGTTPEEAIALNVPAQHLILEREATSTYTNALYTKRKMEEYNLDSAIIVSSDYHMRRIEVVFDRVYGGSDIELIYIASFYGGNAKQHSVRNILFIGREYIKLVGYWLGLYKFIDL